MAISFWWRWLWGNSSRDASRSLDTIDPRELEELDRYVWQAAWLDDPTRRRMIQWSKRFIASKHWEGCNGFRIKDEVKKTIALNASLLVLAYPDWIFPTNQTILVYPRPYKARSRGGDLHHGLGGEYYRSGETLARGPIALNWYDIQRAIHRDNDGDHIVLHEFSHQLDMIDDPKADGVPPLPRGMNADRWKKDFEMEFQWARDMVEQGEAIVVDDYGLTHPSEFFAVATECYFQIPWDLREYQPNLYRMLQEFYVTDLADAMDTP
jgi:Mlc titration factor MtfA (ptsG expression regulator)